MELALSCITLQSSLIHNMGTGVKFIHRQHQNVPSTHITKVETMMWVNLTTVPMLSIKELCNDSANSSQVTMLLGTIFPRPLHMVVCVIVEYTVGELYQRRWDKHGQ